jgi:hypothetical protein
MSGAGFSGATKRFSQSIGSSPLSGVVRHRFSDPHAGNLFFSIVISRFSRFLPSLNKFDRSKALINGRFRAGITGPIFPRINLLSRSL